MPSFECISKLRAVDRDTVLNLTSKHCLVYNNSDTSVLAKKSRFPGNVAIVPASTIVFSLSAVLNRKRLAPELLINSHFAQHFAEFMRANADHLGLCFVSKLSISEAADSSPSINVRTNHNRLPFHDNVPVRVALHAIHLHYSVTTTKESDNNLFSSRLSLPYQSLVDNILRRFVTFHLVKRYPLVFGALCQQLDVEAPYFSNIFRSLQEMARRSRNPAFCAKFKQLIKVLKKQRQTEYTSSLTELAAYLSKTDDDIEDVEPLQLSSETAFCLSMEKLFCDGIKRTTFKTTPVLPMTNSDTHDDEELSRDYTPEHTDQLDSADRIGHARSSSIFLPYNPTTLIGMKEDALWNDYSDHYEDNRIQSTRILDHERPDLFKQSFSTVFWAKGHHSLDTFVPGASSDSMMIDFDADDDCITGDNDDNMFYLSSYSGLLPSLLPIHSQDKSFPKNLECQKSLFSDAEEEEMISTAFATPVSSELGFASVDMNLDTDQDSDMDMDASTNTVEMPNLLLAEFRDIPDVLDLDSDADSGALCRPNNCKHVQDIARAKSDGLSTTHDQDQFIDPSDVVIQTMDLYAANAPSVSLHSSPASTPFAFSASLTPPTIQSNRFNHSPTLEFDFGDSMTQEQQEHVGFAALDQEDLRSDTDNNDVEGIDNALQSNFDSIIADDDDEFDYNGQQIYDSPSCSISQATSQSSLASSTSSTVYSPLSNTSSCFPFSSSFESPLEPLDSSVREINHAAKPFESRVDLPITLELDLDSDEEFACEIKNAYSLHADTSSSKVTTSSSHLDVDMVIHNTDTSILTESGGLLLELHKPLSLNNRPKTFLLDNKDHGECEKILGESKLEFEDDKDLYIRYEKWNTLPTATARSDSTMEGAQLDGLLRDEDKKIQEYQEICEGQQSVFQVGMCVVSKEEGMNGEHEHILEF
ncbi:hypothetical protein F5890DRAFT_1567627 [Lentinula detonsa]|uniref:Uncharacterized protein n=1 Tax=Lentinula detonsa TaxID=2804962 RepID=A0AA38UPH8_9AGAR|nr:hypothetical protein F5890DRAFT_1567627 [Lentinula detonsa]